MARRRPVLSAAEQPEPDADQLRLRFRQLARRVRLSFELEGAEHMRLKREIEAIEAGTDDPARRFEQLLDLAAAAERGEL